MTAIGTIAPDFTLPDTNGNAVRLSAHRGRWVVLWWYPEANTPGCSMQASSLDRNRARFKELNATVLGISFNEVAENDEFACDKDLHLTLLSDPERAVGEEYGVVRRSDEPFPSRPRRHTFVIDPEGLIAYAEDASTLVLARYGEHILDVLAGLQEDATSASATARLRRPDTTVASDSE